MAWPLHPYTLTSPQPLCTCKHACNLRTQIAHPRSNAHAYPSPSNTTPSHAHHPHPQCPALLCSAPRIAATPLAVTLASPAVIRGLIGRSGDADFFSLYAVPGDISIGLALVPPMSPQYSWSNGTHNFSAPTTRSNLNVAVKLWSTNATAVSPLQTWTGGGDLLSGVWVVTLQNEVRGGLTGRGWVGRGVWGVGRGLQDMEALEPAITPPCRLLSFVTEEVVFSADHLQDAFCGGQVFTDYASLGTCTAPPHPPPPYPPGCALHQRPWHRQPQHLMGGPGVHRLWKPGSLHAHGQGLTEWNHPHLQAASDCPAAAAAGGKLHGSCLVKE